MTQSRTLKKLTKFRNSPEDFFADSRNGIVRRLGALVVPRILQSDRAMSLLEDPAAVLRTGRLSPLVARFDRRQAAHRRRVLDAAGRPKISIVMAAWNAVDSIDSAMTSVLEQTYSNLELVVVDDASTDSTTEIVQRRAAVDSRVRLVRTKRQRGAAMARNVGLAEATGAYLTFHDADDVCHAERIERQLAVLLAHPKAVLCICNFRRETPDGHRVTVNGRRFAKIVLSMVFPREPVLRVVGYMLDIKIGEDTEYYERIRTVFGREREVHLFQTLYRARFAPQSLLFSSGETVYDPHMRSVTHSRSKEAERDYENIKLRMRMIRGRRLSPYVPFRLDAAYEPMEPTDETEST